MQLNLENTVIIFDEAHNIEKFAEEGSSVEINTQFLSSVEEEVKALYKVIRTKLVDKEDSSNNEPLIKPVSTGLDDISSLLAPVRIFREYLL